ncbi:MAG: selenocysteine-specific translation elongation factor, partial [Desulfovibrio sp.]|nr:selenocysteine-specific translation elongation factor [Desulfovibrio sp.]
MSVVMGTAGHIDHGKTTLIQALTGIDCDRLAEEKRRGITIELGFAELALPNGRSLSVVDVPGHEKFVRTMVAGATGVDFVLLVVAADEGVMPQTREHMEICSLLGIRSGVVALTKIDAVDAEMLALAEEDIASFLKATVLESAPVIPVSARTGQGLDILRQTLVDIEASLSPVRSQDLFRLPVDRVFTLHGSGTVVTGTLIAGSVNVGDTVELYPSGRKSKVRALQSHGEATSTAFAGRRTAMNIPNLAVEDISRGDVVSFPDTLFPSTRWIIELTCLPSSPRPLRRRAEFHFHHGTREMQARLYFADRDKLQPGESCLCEVRFTEPAPAVFGDRCVIRSFSPLRTVAGGIVLNPCEVDMRRRCRDFAERCRQLVELASGLSSPETLEERVSTQLICTKDAAAGISFERLRVLTNLDSNTLSKTLLALSNRRQVSCFDKTQRLYIADSLLTPLITACETAMSAFHKRNSALQGIKRSELLSSWGKDLPPKLAFFVIEKMLKQGLLAAKHELLHLPGHVVTFSTRDAPLSDAMITIYQRAGLTPPTVNEVLEKLGANKKEAAAIFAALRASGQLVCVSEDIWYAPEHLKTIQTAVEHWFTTHDALDIPEIKAVTGLSRKYMVPLLEFFDAQKLTMRLGNTRILRK